MAYEFTASNQSLSFPSLTFGTADMTIAMKFQTSSSVQYAQLIGNEVTTTGGQADGFTLLINHNSATDGQIRLYISTGSGATNVASATATDWSDGALHDVALVRSGNTFTIWVDAVDRGSGSWTPEIDGATTTYIGRNNAFSPRNLVGSVSEVGIWTGAALNSTEITALYRGFTANQIRPQSLSFYAPLVRDLLDVRGGIAITNNNGATIATHPRIIT